MLDDVRPSVADARHLALRELDRIYYRFETERRHPAYYAGIEQLQIAEPDRHSDLRRATETVEVAARGLVTDRYTRPHVDLEHSLYAHDTDCENDCDHPACQREFCDDCHRTLALIYASAFCGSREEYSPILAWIMDADFLN